MAQVFQQSLASQSQQGADPYQMLIEELQRGNQQPRPMFTPEQIRQRIAQNNAMMNVGLVGQMSGDERMRDIGGKFFQKALAGREERVSQRGIMDPLTGEEAVSPEFQTQQRDQRQGKFLQLALMDQQRREATGAKIASEAAARQHREDMIRLSASLRSRPAGQDPEITGLRADLLRAQVDAARGKVEDRASKSSLALGQAESKVKAIQPLIDEAINATGYGTAGAFGGVAGRVWGTPAYDYARLIDTLKARLGFDELAAMRAASPTGGALGNVSNREIDFLQAAVQSLDTRQSPKTLQQRLNLVKTHYNNWLNLMRQAHAGEASMLGPGGMPAPTVARPAPPQPDTASSVRTPQGAGGRIRFQVGPNGELIQVQ
jgi:hypothetical protein